MNTRSRTIIGTIAAAIVLALCFGSRHLTFAVDETIPGYVTYVTDNTIYIEVVGEHHLKPEETGALKLRGREVAYVKVTEVGTKYVYVQVISQVPGVTLATGDSIVFESRLKPAA